MKKKKKPVEKKVILKEKLTKVKANHPIQNTAFKDLPTSIGCGEFLYFNKQHLNYYGKHVTILDKVKQTKDIPGSDDKKKVKAMSIESMKKEEELTENEAIERKVIQELKEE